MPALQFSIATLSGLLNGNQADTSSKGGEGTGKKSATDQFSSLLDVVGNIADIGSGQGGFSKKDDAKDPVAVEVHTAVPFRDPLDRTIQKVVDNKVDNKESDDYPEPVARVKNDNKNSDNSSFERVTAKSSTQDSKSADKLDKFADNAGGDEVGDVSVLDKLKEKIADKVDNLSNLMGIISRLLAGGNGAVAHIDLTFVQQSQTQVAVGEVQATDPLAVFANLKDILSQLEQFLQVANGQNAPLTEEQNAALTVINNALQNDLNALKSLFPQAVDGGDAQSISNQILQTQQIMPEQKNDGSSSQQSDFTLIDDMKSLLQDDIALIKAALLKFRNERVGEPEKMESRVSEVQVQGQSIAVDVANDDIPSVKPENNRFNSAIFSSAAIVAAIPATEQQQAQNNNIINTPAAVAVQAAGNDAESNAGGNFSSNSGQNGNSQAQFSANGLNASSTRPIGGAGTQFSNLLNRTEQTPVAEQVLFHIKSAIGNGNSKITIQLSPEDLGKLDITLNVDAKGKTDVTITADNKQTLDLLQRDSSGLQKALADAGLKADSNSLSFNLRGGEKEGQGQNQYQAASQYQKSQPDELSPEEINITSIAAVTRSYTINLPDGLDIKI